MTELQREMRFSTQDFMALGVEQVAYVKPVQIEGETVYAVHAADGTQMAIIDERATAFAAVRKNDMEPLSVH
jgi:hypothetical protein